MCAYECSRGCMAVVHTRKTKKNVDYFRHAPHGRSGVRKADVCPSSHVFRVRKLKLRYGLTSHMLHKTYVTLCVCRRNSAGHRT